MNRISFLNCGYAFKGLLAVFDPREVLGHCDVVSWFSDFAFYLEIQLIYFIQCTSFRL